MIAVPSTRALAIGAGALLAVGAIAAQQVRIEGLHLRPHVGPVGFTLIDVEGWRPRARAAEQALAQMKAAQSVAAAAQAAANHQPAAISAAIARGSDHDAQAYYDQGRAAGAAYAAAHGVRPAACAQGVAGNAAVPRADHAAPVDDRPGDAAAMVAVARADFDQLTANSLRLAKVHQDASALITAGVAVAEPFSPTKKD